MTDADVISDKPVPPSWDTNLQHIHKEKSTLNVITVSTRCDRVELDSQDSLSPVKKLITMYNSNGLAAQKALRRKAIGKKDGKSQFPSCVPLTSYTSLGSTGDSTALDGLVESDEGSPRYESDDEICWISQKDENRLEDLGLTRTTSETVSAMPNRLSLCTEDNILNTNEILWEISGFDLDQAIYESNVFDLTDQCWNFSFGHNNADGYGFILCLQQPQIDSLQLQCSFNMYKSGGLSYSKTREEPYVFGINSMNSRGFVNFASTETVMQHVQGAGLLMLSVTLTVIGDNVSSPYKSCSTSANRHSSEDFITRQVATKSSPSDSCRGSAVSPLIGSPTLFSHSRKESNRDCNKFRTSLMIGCGSMNSDDSLASHSNSDKLLHAALDVSPFPTAKQPPISPPSFKSFIAFNRIYITSPNGHDFIRPEGVNSPLNSPPGLVAPPYSSMSGETSPAPYESLFCSCCDKKAFVDHKRCYSDSESLYDNFLSSETNEEYGPTTLTNISIHDDSTYIEGDEAPKRKTLLDSTRDNGVDNDETLLNNRRTSLQASLHIDDSDDEEAHESTTSEGSNNNSPPQDDQVINSAYVIRSIPKIPYNSICGNDHAKQMSISRKAFLPREPGKQYNLLADSLRLLSQRVHVECLNVPEPKNINLTLPFQKLHEAITTGEGITTGDEATPNNRQEHQDYSLNNIPNNCQNSRPLDNKSSPRPGTQSVKHSYMEVSQNFLPTYLPSIGNNSSPSNDTGSDQEADHNSNGKREFVETIKTDTDGFYCISGDSCGVGFAQSRSIDTKSTSHPYAREFLFPRDVPHKSKLMSKKVNPPRKQVRCKKFMKKNDVKHKRAQNVTTKIIHEYSNVSSIVIALLGIVLNQFIQKELLAGIRLFIFCVISIIVKSIIFAIAVTCVVMMN